MNLKETIKNAVDARRSEILDFLERMVNINSYSHNKKGIDKVGELVRSYMPGLFGLEVDRQADHGDHYVYRNTRSKVLRRLLLGGHIDTLCPENPEFNSIRDTGGFLIGPGVNDMKGGVAVMVWCLRILDEIGLLDEYPISCIVNGDEELGSPTSTPLFRGMKGEAKLAMIYECGGPDCTVVTTRRGSYRKVMRVTGVPNHFGNLKEQKVSAVEELAHRIIQIENYNQSDGSLIANAGKVWGGIARNAVADSAGMDFEVRFWDTKLGENFSEEFEASIKKPYVEGCYVELEDILGRPPMERSSMSMEFFRLIVETGKTLGQTIIEEERGGLSDANWLSYDGVPTIDGLGPLGDKDFTTDEYIVKETLFDRIELSANVIVAIMDKWFDR